MTDAGESPVDMPSGAAPRGVLAALLIGFVGMLLFGRRAVRAQEDRPLSLADLEAASIE